MQNEPLNYQSKGVECHGMAVYDPRITQKRPGVIVAHAWRGQDEFARQKAAELAGLGYVGFAADVYGEGKTANSDEEAAALMIPLFKDRELLRERIVSAYDALKKHPHVDPNKIGVIGFCFGGLTAIELLKSGSALKGVVSFHGLLGETIDDIRANEMPIAEHLKGSLLVLHGDLDPLVSQEDIIKFRKTMTAANVDWQLHIFGHALHAFTNPLANDKGKGLVYNSKSATRSWIMMKNFFEEVFS